jgi:dihydrofolate synthase / folylpolyglutamate synthase
MKPLEWLYSLEGRGSVLGLDRVKSLLEKLDNPHLKLKCIHVAGTNGKGSVCAMIASILKEAGYKTGMYTSPHLKRFSERIQINGQDISDEEIVELVDRIKPYYTDQTFFEVTTAMAFLYFMDKGVDFLVMEVGLGGRLDATNVVMPLLSIITNISLEHTQILGENEEKIAYEKAGIIKENIPVVTLAKGDALRVIGRITKEKNSKIYIPRKYHKKDNCFDINSYKRLSLSLNGDFQLENASIALKAVDVLKENGITITDKSIKNGLENVKWPGRLEFIGDNVLVDCAHNPDAIIALHKEVDMIRKDFDKVISVIGILKDKDKSKMVREVEAFSDYIIFAKPNTERATEPDELANSIDVKHEIILDVRKALKKAKKLANPDDLIVVTGSIYTVGEVS